MPAEVGAFLCFLVVIETIFIVALVYENGHMTGRLDEQKNKEKKG